jgi:integrase
VLLLRYSGLRFTDAAKLSRGRISGDNLLLYTAKTGTPVNCPLPPVVIDALAAIPSDGPYYFWTGKSATKGLAGSIWRRPLRWLSALAKVANGHAHRFWDTFAVELLLAGVPIDRVSMLLGHKSVRITERHYAPWVRSRQEQLEADVRKTWDVAVRRRARPGHTRKKRVVST